MARFLDGLTIILLFCFVASAQSQNVPSFVPTNSQNVVLSFITVNGYGNNLYVDNISAGARPGIDVSILGLKGIPKDTSYVVGSGPFVATPTVTIANLGSQAVVSSFTLTAACVPGNYTSTRTISSLASGEVRGVTMDELTISAGVAVNLIIASSLNSDVNRSNDTLRQYTAVLSGVQRSVLLEEATNTSCGPCAANNPTIDGFIAALYNTIVAIKYHAWWPGLTDPMYVANKSQNAERINYYSINGVPTVQVDGPTLPQYPYLTGTSLPDAYEARLSKGTPFTLSVTDTRIAGDTIVADVTVGVVNAVRAGDYRLRVNAVERAITYATAPGTNGEKTFYDVFRRAYPSTQGTAVSTSIGTQTFQFRYRREAAWVDSLIYTAVFIQNDITKEVMNCAKTRHYAASALIAVEHCVEATSVVTPKKELRTRDAVPSSRLIPSFADVPSSQPGFFAELFEGGFLPSGWRLGNPDHVNSFEPYQVNGPSFGGTTAVALLFFDYGTVGARDTLYSPVLSGLTRADSITFDWAYAKYSGFNDRLTVKVSVDGGRTFPYTIFDRDTLTLPTAPATNSYFAPTTSGQWGRFSYSLDALLAVEDNSGGVAEEFVLHQNYPNPFNPTTVVSYQLPVSSEVHLIVYDMLGREVSTLVAGKISSGAHTVTFNAQGLSSGLYFYRLITDRFVSTRAMTLLK